MKLSKKWIENMFGVIPDSKRTTGNNYTLTSYWFDYLDLSFRLQKQTPSKFSNLSYEDWTVDVYRFSPVKEHSPEYKDLIRKYGILNIHRNRDVYYPVFRSSKEMPGKVLVQEEVMEILVSFLKSERKKK